VDQINQSQDNIEDKINQTWTFIFLESYLILLASIFGFFEFFIFYLQNPIHLYIFFRYLSIFILSVLRYF